MHLRRMPSYPLVVFGLYVLGCGGQDIVGSSPSITMSISKPSVSYGQGVTVSWSSHGVDSISSASFPITSSMLSGSLTDTPTVPTTYSITGRGNNGKDVTATITISVAKGSKKILFLADIAQSGINQVTELIQGLSAPRKRY